MHEQNIICSKTRLDGTTHEQTIIRRQLFAGHMVDSRPMEMKKKTHRMIRRISCWTEGANKNVEWSIKGLNFTWLESWRGYHLHELQTTVVHWTGNGFKRKLFLTIINNNCSLFQNDGLENISNYGSRSERYEDQEKSLTLWCWIWDSPSNFFFRGLHRG